MNELTDFRAHHPPPFGDGDDDTSHLEGLSGCRPIIVDASMVDTWLANQLLSNIATDTKLLIVDYYQLDRPGSLRIPSTLRTKC